MSLAALAHEVDATGGAASAFHHAGGATQHFHAVIDGHVAVEAVGLYVAAADVQRHAVVLVLTGHAKAARVEILAAHGRVVHGDARGLFHHLFDGVEVLVIEHLAGHHRDRLRCFLQRVHALANGHATGGVGVAAFGGGAQALRVDVGRSQFHRVAGGRAEHGHGVAVTLIANAGALEHRVQRIIVLIAAVERAGAQTLQAFRAVDDLQTGLLTKGLQRLRQWLGRNVQGPFLRLHIWR